MQRWLSAFSASCLSVATANRSTLVLWPQYIDANHYTSTDNVTAIEALNGEVLSTFSMKTTTQSEVSLDPLIESIEVGKRQITWKPATHLQSSTFDRFFASSTRFEGINAVGIHLRAKLRKGVEGNAITKTILEQIEDNVRKILRNVLPLSNIHSRLSKGFLVKSLCDSHSWKNSNLPTKISLKSTFDMSRTCLSSSLSFWPEDESSSFYTIQKGNDFASASDNLIFERALFEAHQTFLTSRYEPKLTVIRLSRGSATVATIEAEYLGASIMTLSSPGNFYTAAVPISNSASDVLLVMSITRKVDMYELKYVWLQRNGKPAALAVLITTIEVQVLNPAAAASLQVAITGEGFHRRLIMDVKVVEVEVCGRVIKKKETIFVRVPIPNTAYIDLDEIRRMERIDERKLISFPKRIEIERPSSISSQYVVGLELTMSSADQLHLDLPIHFRYQAPSEDKLYRQAVIVAPDFFLVCQAEEYAHTKVNSSHDDAIFSFFQTWGVFDQVTSRSDTFWLPLISKSPLPETVVLIPVGFLPQRWLVSSVTLFFACMGAAVLIWLSLGNVSRAKIGDKVLS